MSSPVFCADVAPEHPVLFSYRSKPGLVIERLAALPKLVRVTAASRLEVRPAPELVSSGIHELDALTGGLPRGCLTEICGAASSGRTSVLLATLAAATRRQEVCAVVDVSDAFDPLSAAAAGVDFERTLWVRCGDQSRSTQRHRDTEKKQIHPRNNREGHDFCLSEKFSSKPASRATRPAEPNFTHSAAERHQNAAHGASRGWEESEHAPNGRQSPAADTKALEQALRATDLLLQSGGFGLIILDLGDVPFKDAHRIPLTTWFRFQRAVETTPTILFVIATAPLAQTCASLLVKLSAVSSQLSNQNITGGHGFSRAAKSIVELWASAPGVPAHAQLLEGIHIEGELLHSRLERKPVQSVTTAFATANFKLKAGR
jgi:RecA/RadA recombinase